MHRSSRFVVVCCACETSVGPRALPHGFRDSFGGSFYEVEAILRRRRQQFMSASAEEHAPNALQVMSPNATATQEVLRGNVEANHESVG